MCAHVRIVENTLKIQQHIDAMCTYIYIYVCVYQNVGKKHVYIYIYNCTILYMGMGQNPGT